MKLLKSGSYDCKSIGCAVAENFILDMTYAFKTRLAYSEIIGTQYITVYR